MSLGSRLRTREFQFVEQISDVLYLEGAVFWQIVGLKVTDWLFFCFI